MLRLQGKGKLVAIAAVKKSHEAVGELATWDTRELDKLVAKGGSAE
jgi:hypothetical protein